MHFKTALEATTSNELDLVAKNTQRVSDILEERLGDAQKSLDAIAESERQTRNRPPVNIPRAFGQDGSYVGLSQFRIEQLDMQLSAFSNSLMQSRGEFVSSFRLLSDAIEAGSDMMIGSFSRIELAMQKVSSEIQNAFLGVVSVLGSVKGEFANLASSLGNTIGAAASGDATGFLASIPQLQRDLQDLLAPQGGQNVDAQIQNALSVRRRILNADISEAQTNELVKPVEDLIREIVVRAVRSGGAFAPALTKQFEARLATQGFNIDVARATQALQQQGVNLQNPGENFQGLLETSLRPTLDALARLQDRNAGPRAGFHRFPSSDADSPSVTRGIQIGRITGESRNIILDALRPVNNLVQLVSMADSLKQIEMNTRGLAEMMTGTRAVGGFSPLQPQLAGLSAAGTPENLETPITQAGFSGVGESGVVVQGDLNIHVDSVSDLNPEELERYLRRRFEVQGRLVGEPPRRNRNNNPREF